MNNPCVIIATHDRLKITTVNIKQLISQGVAVILVVTDSNESDYYNQFDVHLVQHSNNPLGAKWQAGIDYAVKLNYTHYVITGSDDLLSLGFFDRYCTDIPFTGFKRWYIWHKDKLHLLNYKPLQPLGGGRVYTRWAIERLNYQVWNTSKDRFLDDYAFNTSNWAWDIHREPEILAVKGDWPVMNKVDLSHRNVNLMATWDGAQALKIMKERFNYEP